MNYLDTCMEIAANEADAVASLRLGETVGHGSMFVFKQLGKLMTAGYAGIKLPTSSLGAESRFYQEITQISLYASRSPELTAKMPAFMCLVKIEGSNEAGLLTEDASQGGLKEVRPRNASAETRKLLSNAFHEYGQEKDLLDDETLRIATAFDVDGTERLLDFTPEPVNSSLLYMAGEDLLAPYYEEVYDNLDRLTITVPASSALATDILS